MKTRPSTQKSLSVVVCLFLLNQFSLCRAQSFTDDFNRADSSVVGNGWSDLSGNIGGNLGIVSNELTFAPTQTPNAQAGIYRPFTFSAPLTITATLREMNGYYGNLLGRYGSTFRVLNDGSLGDGYGILVYRGDNNYDDSAVVVEDGTNAIATLLSTFQYGPEINVSVTFNPDGSLAGNVSQPGETFDFSFGPHAVEDSGANVSYETWGSTVVPPRMDEISISTIPEPSAFILCLVSGFGLVAFCRTRRAGQR